MTLLTSTDLPAFLRKYRFPGGRVRRVRVLYSTPREVAVEMHLTVNETVKDLGSSPRRVHLILRLEGVEEFRFQMRPSQPRVKIADARISFLNGLFFVNLDAWGLEPGEQPRIHDFRAGEAYVGGRTLFWEERGKTEARPGEPTMPE